MFDETNNLMWYRDSCGGETLCSFFFFLLRVGTSCSSASLSITPWRQWRGRWQWGGFHGDRRIIMSCGVPSLFLYSPDVHQRLAETGRALRAPVCSCLCGRLLTSSALNFMSADRFIAASSHLFVHSFLPNVCLGFLCTCVLEEKKWLSQTETSASRCSTRSLGHKQKKMAQDQPSYCTRQGREFIGWRLRWPRVLKSTLELLTNKMLMKAFFSASSIGKLAEIGSLHMFPSLSNVFRSKEQLHSVHRHGSESNEQLRCVETHTCALLVLCDCTPLCPSVRECRGAESAVHRIDVMCCPPHAIHRGDIQL